MSQNEEVVPIESLDLIMELDRLVDRSYHFLTKTLIDTEEFYALTKRIKDALPEDVKAADRITREADHIVRSAREQANHIIDESRAEASRIVEEAKAEAQRLVDSSEISRLATAQSKEIIESAEEEAQAIKAGADTYAREVLSDLESHVIRVLNTIRRGREKLQRGEKPEVEDA